MSEVSAPIGVFDSGVGGLTVLRALRYALPGENFVYLGDTARLPYGTKSAETVVRYSLQCAAALVERGIRLLVVACNTASASSLAELRAHYPNLTVIGVIEPGAQAAVAASRNRHVAVIGTEGTVNGNAYPRAILSLNPETRIVQRACSLFVSLAEEGWGDGELAEAVARRYLDPLFEGEALLTPDTLVLGCTHFPVLAEAIRAVLPSHVRMVDSALTTASAVSQALKRLETIQDSAGPAGTLAVPGHVRYLATDSASRFAQVGSNFLRERIAVEDIEVIDL